jgi:hypothetical protein
VTQISVHPPIRWGDDWPWFATGIPTGAPTTVLILDNINERVAFMFQAPRTGTLRRVAWRQALGSAGTNTKRVSFQDIAADGFPDGTADQFRLDAAGNSPVGWQVSGLITDDGTDTGVLRSVTVGDWIALVFDYSAYTSGTWNPQAISNAKLGQVPYGASSNTSAVWSKVTSTLSPLAMLEYTTFGWLTLGPSVYPVDTNETTTFNVDSTADEIGNRFIPPATVTVVGLQLPIDGDGDYDVRLYDAASALLATSPTVDADYRHVVTPGHTNVYFTSEVVLQRATLYRVAVRPLTTTNIVIYGFNLPTSDYLNGLVGGSEHYSTSRADAGAWTDLNTRKFHMGLLLRGFDDGSGATGFAGAPFSRIRLGM